MKLGSEARNASTVIQFSVTGDNAMRQSAQAAPSTNRKLIDRYLRLNFYRAGGMMTRLDAAIFRTLILGQSVNDITGGLVEIGVHYGRSFFVLALGRSGTEKCLGIDLFEDDNLHTSKGGLGRMGVFRSNCQQFGFNFQEDEILKANSLDLTADSVVSRVGPVRFFSVDGGHMYRHATNDILLAEAALLSAELYVSTI